jgi:hypothetical protein
MTGVRAGLDVLVTRLASMLAGRRVGLLCHRGIGSWDGGCLSLGDCVTGTEPTDGAAAAGGRSC